MHYQGILVQSCLLVNGHYVQLLPAQNLDGPVSAEQASTCFSEPSPLATWRDEQPQEQADPVSRVEQRKSELTPLSEDFFERALQDVADYLATQSSAKDDDFWSSGELR